MITYLDILVPILSFLIAYLLGGIPTSIIVGKVFFKQDVRDYGSKNPGGTNATRLWGKKVGFTIIFIDMIKAIAPVWIAILVIRFTNLNNLMLEDSKSWAIWLAPLGSVVGHCYSIYLKFKGGKGVSTIVGSLGSTNVVICGLGFITFIVTLFTKRMVSLASILMSLVATITSWVLYILYSCGYEAINNLFIFHPELLNMNIAYPIVVTLMTIIIIVRHRENIVRMLKNQERHI